MAAASRIWRQYSCPFCSIVFKKRIRHKEHMNAEHAQCRQCLKRFGTSELLRTHQEETGHLFCPECGICFPERYSHLRHVRDLLHTAYYQCCECGREYTSLHTLSNHCCDCDRLFRDQLGLSSHLSTHSAHVPRVAVPRVHKSKQCSERVQG